MPTCLIIWTEIYFYFNTSQSIICDLSTRDTDK